MWQLLLSALFGLLAGLVGTGFQAHLQRKEKAEERLERRRELKRDKAELAFREVAAVVAWSNERMMAAMMLLNSGPSADTKYPPNEPLQRLAAIVSVYFPALTHHLDQYQKRLDELTQEVSTDIGKLVASNATGKEMAGRQLVYCAKVRDVSISFASSVRADLSKAVETLW